jgi:hypothetical protein
LIEVIPGKDYVIIVLQTIRKNMKTEHMIKFLKEQEKDTIILDLSYLTTWEDNVLCVVMMMREPYVLTILKMMVISKERKRAILKSIIITLST